MPSTVAFAPMIVKDQLTAFTGIAPDELAAIWPIVSVVGQSGK